MLGCHALLWRKVCMQQLFDCDKLGMVLQAAGQTDYMSSFMPRKAQGAPPLSC